MGTWPSASWTRRPKHWAWRHRHPARLPHARAAPSAATTRPVRDHPVRHRLATAPGVVRAQMRAARGGEAAVSLPRDVRPLHPCAARRHTGDAGVDPKPPRRRDVPALRARRPRRRACPADGGRARDGGPSRGGTLSHGEPRLAARLVRREGRFAPGGWTAPRRKAASQPDAARPCRRSRLGGRHSAPPAGVGGGPPGQRRRLASFARGGRHRRTQGDAAPR